ncbi:MAG: winged helix-turn-helix transcriptional regulator, partial [Thermoplasmata archaeon]|nr:winged helix-turn-helix transcriptional regulator [Thermoplasmata archaeon]
GDYAVMFSVSTSDPRVMDHQATVMLTVESVVGFAPGIGDLHLEAAIGEETTGLITVVNEGNVPTTILGAVPTSYDDLPNGWDLVTPDLPLTIPPFTKATFNTGVRLPDDPVGSLSGGHHIPLRLLTDKGIVDLDLGLQVFVPEVRITKIEVQGEWHLTGSTNSEMSLRLLVRDSGNLMLDRAVWLTFEGGPAITYVEVSDPSFTMRSGKIVPLVLTVMVDQQAVPGEHWVQLRAYDGSGLLTKLAVPIHVVEPLLSLVGDLEVRAVQDDGHYAGGEAGIYVVTGYVENGGDEDLAFAKVDVYDSSSGSPDHLGYVPIYDLPAGARRAFRFTLDRAEPGQNVVLAHVTGPGSGAGDPSTNSLESQFEAEAMAPVPEGQYVFLVFAVAIGAMAGLVAILGTEAGRFALMAFVLIPLYTRLKPEQVTDHFIRGQILGYVKANPGETYTHIRKALKLSNGTFVYHARILESQDHIRSIKDGANRRFYPAEMRIPAEVKDVELNQVQRMIYTIVMEYPGISQTKISKMVKLAPSTVNYHVNIMTKVGVIERKRSGRLSLCFVTEDAD